MLLEKFFSTLDTSQNKSPARDKRKISVDQEAFVLNKTFDCSEAFSAVISNDTIEEAAFKVLFYF